MRIIRVELENIKSYRRTNIPLAAGTVAVRGHNGAGKSTLVEAIGFALFDALGYSQEQFVREGERYGTVTITFLSALDGREYQVVRRCGSSATWYVYDPEIAARVVEQRQDVLDFLRKHLRIETDIKLSDLFTDALGVPQGTFTADFLLTPANRKKKFDTLLQVEDYRKAAERLNETRNYLIEQRRGVETRIADLERETGQLEGWREQLVGSIMREGEIVEHLRAIEAEVARVEARLTALRAQQVEVALLASEAQVATTAAESLEARLRDAEKHLGEARTAMSVCQAARPEYTAHLAAQTQREAATVRAGERDALAQQRATVAQHHEGAGRDLHHAQARLAEARKAEQRLAALMPAVTRQGELEREREVAANAMGELDAARRALQTAERDLAQVVGEIAETERQIAELEALRPLAELLAVRRENVSMLQDIRAQRTEKQKRLDAIGRELRQAEIEREAAGRAEAKAREWVTRISENAALAEELPTLEARAEAIDTDVRRVEARMEQHRISREQSGAGNCPFLREPCLNIRAKGMNSLGAYFDDLLAEDERALVPLRAQRADLTPRVEQGRKVRPHYERLAEYKESHAQTRTALGRAEDRLMTLEVERDEIAAWLEAAQGEKELSEAQALFHQSDEADKSLRRIGPLQSQVRGASERCERLERERQAQREAAERLAGAPERAEAIKSELAALDDPKSKAAALTPVASEREGLEEQGEQLGARVVALAGQLFTLEASLAEYAGVDAELASLRAELERTTAGYTRHLQHEQIAGRLAERESTATQASHEARAALARRDAAAEAARLAAAAFDAEELAGTARRADELGSERGRATQELTHIQQEGQRLRGEIARVEALLGDLTTAHGERAALVDDEALLQQFRETIKEAGPNILRALLKQISTDANRIFGDVLGDHAAELTWENDYEIVLRRDGKDRSFAQLSGGEQMSAALAVRLALLRTLTRLNIAFFDEPTQNMDDQRRGNLAEQIRRVRGFDQLIVISHDDTFEQGLDSMIYLEKRNGETLLVAEDTLVAV